MNEWQRTRKRSGWRCGGLAEWIEDDTAYISVVFSWLKQDAYQKAVWYRMQGYDVKVGGPAADYDPGFFGDMYGRHTDALVRHNPNATFTSRGCIRKCSFCIVPKIEGGLVELDDWPVRPMVCDNNLLACSGAHFDNVIDKLKTIRGVDFNQGLDARLLTKHHASRLAELDLRFVRLAWDDVRYETQFASAFEKLRVAGIAKHRISVYVLIGFTDTQEDALYRLETIHELGVFPNPMRYQPLDAMRRNQYVGEHWTEYELKRYMRYWSNIRYFRSIPFGEYRLGGHDTRNSQKLI